MEIVALLDSPRQHHRPRIEDTDTERRVYHQLALAQFVAELLDQDQFVRRYLRCDMLLLAEVLDNRPRSIGIHAIVLLKPQ